MIRINLLGMPRPRARRPAVPAEATRPVMLLIFSVAIAVAVLGFDYYMTNKSIGEEERKVSGLRADKARLEKLKTEVDTFAKQKAVLEQRIRVIEELQRNRTGGQELLDMVATTVTRTEALWLTSMTRKGNSLTFEGSAGSINAVANFITQLKRSGYFDKVEIKESRQDERSQAVATFLFTLTAEFALPQGKEAAPAAPRKS